MKKLLIKVVCTLVILSLTFAACSAGIKGDNNATTPTEISSQISVEESSAVRGSMDELIPTPRAKVSPEPTLEPEVEIKEYDTVGESSPIVEEESGNVEETTTEEPETDMQYQGKWRVTFYDNCSQCCGKWAGGPTASGVYPTANHTVACGKNIPFGTVIYIEGLGYYVCEDRGVGNGCIDIYVNNHSEIPSWGVGYFDAYIVSENNDSSAAAGNTEAASKPEATEKPKPQPQEESAPVEEEVVVEEPQTSSGSPRLYEPSEFKWMGVLNWGGWRWTYYSQRVLPGGGLKIPGRHVDSDGYVCDENGYICLASSTLAWGTIVDTPLGKQGRVYDSGCAANTLDVYCDW